MEAQHVFQMACEIRKKYRLNAFQMEINKSVQQTVFSKNRLRNAKKVIKDDATKWLLIESEKKTFQRITQ